MKAIHVVVAFAILGGCTSVKLAQRDGCWVRRTEKWPGRVSEEIGPCTPPRTEWSDDRLTRVVQECIARTDYHWQTRALIAWNKGQPLPEQATEAGVLQDCMNETSRALASDNERLNEQAETLRKRLADVGGERDALRTRADDAAARLLANQEKIADRLFAAQDKLGDRLLTGQEKMAGYLGEAARKSSQPAVATATANSSSDGSATTDSSAAAPAMPAMVTKAATREPRVTANRTRPTAARRARDAAPVCPPTGADAAARTEGGPKPATPGALPAATSASEQRGPGAATADPP